MKSKFDEALTLFQNGQLNKAKDISLLNGLDDNSNFYFLHSYYFESKNDNYIISTTEYGKNFVSIINRNNIYGVQFHPEKSHQFGVQLLMNFSKI